jgi:hypothetical protein
MKFEKHFAAVAVMLSLAACSGQSPAPKASAFIEALLPEAKRPKLSGVAICPWPKAYGGETWHATIAFEDGNAYQYHLEMDFIEHPVSLKGFDTKAQRPTPNNLWDSDVKGCFSDHQAYFIRAKGAKLAVSVHEDILINSPFDAAVKARFTRAAEAVEDAVARQKSYVPTESTWGATL